METGPMPIVLIVLLLCSSFLLLGTSYVNVITLPAVANAEAKPKPIAKAEPAPAPKIKQKDLPKEAYKAARQLILERYPDAERVSEYVSSPVDQKGNVFSVIIWADLYDYAGNPVRSFFQVDLALQGNTFQLQALRQ